MTGPDAFVQRMNTLLSAIQAEERGTVERELAEDAMAEFLRAHVKGLPMPAEAPDPKQRQANDV